MGVLAVVDIGRRDLCFLGVERELAEYLQIGAGMSRCACQEEDGNAGEVQEKNNKEEDDQNQIFLCLAGSCGFDILSFHSFRNPTPHPCSYQFNLNIHKSKIQNAQSQKTHTVQNQLCLSMLALFLSTSLPIPTSRYFSV